MAVKNFNNDNFEQAVLKAKKPVLVDFFASWCGPCQMAAPVIEELAEEYKDKLVVGKVDVEKAKEVASQYNIMSIPAVIIFKDGKEVDRVVGFPGKDGYEAMIKKHCKVD